MERFVFVVAIIFAAIFALFGIVGGAHHFHIDVDGIGPDPIMPVAAGQAPQQTFAGESIQFRHVAAHVTVVAEDRTDFAVEIVNPGHAPMPSVSVDEGRVVVDGHLGRRIAECTSDDGAELRGYATVSLAEMPQITVHAPRALTISYNGAGRTEVSGASSVDVDLAGCGTVSAGDVAGNLKVDLAGSGHVRAGAIQHLEVDMAGSGGVETGAVANGANIDIGGSGTVIMASLAGALESDSAGSGGVTVNGGALTSADIELAGSGDASVAATIQHAKVEILGSGDVTLSGQVGDIDASIAGSGDVHAASVTGAVRKDVMGSGNVIVGATNSQ